MMYIRDDRRGGRNGSLAASSASSASSASNRMHRNRNNNNGDDDEEEEEDDDVVICDDCSASRSMNRNMQSYYSKCCGYELCEKCLAKKFDVNPETQCKWCSTILKKSSFQKDTIDIQRYNSSSSERTKLERVYNMELEDFDNNQQKYNLYLEEVEDIVFARVYGSVEERKKADAKIEQYKKKNATQIKQRQNRKLRRKQREDMQKSGGGGGGGGGVGDASTHHLQASYLMSVYQNQPKVLAHPSMSRHGGGGGDPSGRAQNSSALELRGGGHRATDERTRCLEESLAALQWM